MVFEEMAKAGREAALVPRKKYVDHVVGAPINRARIRELTKRLYEMHGFHVFLTDGKRVAEDWMRKGYMHRLHYGLVSPKTLDESVAEFGAMGSGWSLKDIVDEPCTTLKELEERVTKRPEKWVGGFVVVYSEMWSKDGVSHEDRHDRVFGWFPVAEGHAHSAVVPLERGLDARQEAR